jgi:tripartite ATP-independent transporter DctM subunit
LAQVNVLLSVFFAGISGSASADAAGQGKLFIEAQVKEGYDLSFSIAVTAVSAVLAVIIPPSILMVVWGGVISTSIGAMYLAGIVPGVLLCLAQMATVHAYAVKRNYPVYPRADLLEIVKSAGVAIPAMLTPVIIVGGILLGWFTATESAAADQTTPATEPVAEEAPAEDDDTGHTRQEPEAPARGAGRLRRGARVDARRTHDTLGGHRPRRACSRC